MNEHHTEDALKNELNHLKEENAKLKVKTVTQ